MTVSAARTGIALWLRSLRSFPFSTEPCRRLFSSTHPPPLSVPSPKHRASGSPCRRDPSRIRKASPPKPTSSSSSSSSLLESISAILAPAISPERRVDEKPCRQCARRISPQTKEEEDMVNKMEKLAGIIQSRNPDASAEVCQRPGGVRQITAEEDVSPKVEKIAAIVRSKCADLSAMAERLRSSDAELTPEIAEMVVKRCFKDSAAAVRFFCWARRQPGFCHPLGAYNAMLYIAGEARDIRLLDELLQWMDEDGIVADLKTWTILVQSFGRGRRVGRALWAFEQMKKKTESGPDSKAYYSIIRALCEAGKTDMAVEFYREMTDARIAAGGDLYLLLMTSLAKAGDVGMAKQVAEDVARGSVKIQAPTTVLKAIADSKVPSEESVSSSLLLKSLCLSGNVDEAMAEARRKKVEDQANLEILVCGLAKAGRVDEAMELNGGKLCKHIVSGFLRRRDLPAAVAALQAMEEGQSLPGVRTYTEVIQHLFRGGDVVGSCELYKRMAARGVEPDEVAEVAMAAGLAQNGRVAEACEFFQRMEKKTNKSLSVFARELCKAGEPELASRAMTGGDIAGLVAVSPMKKKEQRLLRAPSNTQRREVELVQRILSSSDDWAVIEEQLKKTKIAFSPELAEGVLLRRRQHRVPGGAVLRFFSWVGRTAGFTHTVKAYNMAMKIAGAGKDFVFMLRLHEEMKAAEWPRSADSWAIVISQYGRAGLTELAMKKFAEMKAEGTAPTACTFKFLILYLCGKKGRRLDQAEQLFSEMLAVGFFPDRELISALVSALCEAGRVAKARTCVDLLTQRGVLTAQSGFSLLVNAYSRTGHVDAALELLGGGAAFGLKVDEAIYSSLVNGLLRQGRESAAVAMIEEMKMAGFAAMGHVYTSLMAHHFREKRPERAAELMKTMEEGRCPSTTVTCSVLIDGYVGAGKVNEAWELLRKMGKEGPPPDFRTYSSFMSALCRAGRSEEAVGLIEEMATAGFTPSTVDFRTVFFGLNREGKHDLAQSVLEKKRAFSRKRRFLG
ncbi:pentatricopeptide repeat (PPR) superfamily protein [Wolffia australiana]